MKRGMKNKQKDLLKIGLKLIDFHYRGYALIRVEMVREAVVDPLKSTMSQEVLKPSDEITLTLTVIKPKTL